MKHTVHVTLVVSVEVEASTKSEALVEALGKVEATDGNVFHATAEVFESYPEDKKLPKRGIGSY